jgi:acetyltransferase
MPNAGHRAEVQKLLVLDTRLGDAAERLYARMGYRRVGVIPKFALSLVGRLEATVIFYRNLTT